MIISRAKAPFRFSTQASLTQITNWKAASLQELLAGIREVPDPAIYYHTHRFLEQHQFLSPEPPNDFAYWVETALQEVALAEELSSIDTIRFSTLSELRQKIIDTVSRHLTQSKTDRQARPGNEFYFMEAVTFVLNTSYEAWTLEEFAETLKKVSIHSLYYHVFEARMRLTSGRNDFSDWLEKALGEAQLAAAFAKMDIYTQTLEGLRRRMITLINERTRQLKEETIHANSH